MAMTGTRALALTFALVGLLFAGCDNKSSTPGQSPKGPVGGGAKKVEVGGIPLVKDAETTGTVTGSISFEGARPEVKKDTRTESDPFCSMIHPKGIDPESEIVGPGGELANVFVWVKRGITQKYAPPAEPHILDQLNCRYVPHVSGMMAGQEIEIRNSDDVMHNVHAHPQKNEEFNFAQPKKGDVQKKQFLLQEVMVWVSCDAHKWMGSFVGVVSHPFFAVSGADGKFEIKWLPPGEYTIEAIHEVYGKQEQVVKVGAKETQAITFKFSK